MKYPQKFYYEKLIETAFYDTSASDTLDAERYIQGQPCFLHEKEIKRLVKKKIILYNWDSVININLTPREQRSLVHHLLDDGFEVYATLSLSHMFVKLDKVLYDAFFKWDSLSSANISNGNHKRYSLNNTSMTNPVNLTAKTLLSTAERELHLPANEIMLLDELTAYLLCEKIPETESIELSFEAGHAGINIWNTTEEAKRLRDINPDDYSRIRHFNISVSRHKIKEFENNIQQIQAYLKGENTSVNLVPELDFSTKILWCEKLLWSKPLQPEEKDKAIAIEREIQKRKSIKLLFGHDAILTQSHILKIIESLPNTQSISFQIGKFENKSPSVITEANPNTSITTLELAIRDTVTPSDQLQIGAIFSALPNLESLRLDKIPENANLTLPVIPSLKILSVKVTEPTSDFVSQLRNFENLECLILTTDHNTIYCNFRDILMKLQRDKSPLPILSKLKHLECNGFIFENKDDFEAFLELTPNLTTLIMEPVYSMNEPKINGKRVKKTLFLNPPQGNVTEKNTLIPKLKFLTLINFNLSLESDFSGILSAAKLEQFNFSNCNFLTKPGMIDPQTLIHTKVLSLSFCEFENPTLPYLIQLLGQSLTSLYISSAALNHGKGDEPGPLKAPNTLKAISLFDSKAPHGLNELIAASSLTHLITNEPLPVKHLNFRESSPSYLVISSEMLEHKPNLASTASTLILNMNHDGATYNFNRLNLVDSLPIKTLSLNFDTLLKSGTYSRYLNLASLIHFLNHLSQMETLIINLIIDDAKSAETLIKSFNDPIIKPLTKLKLIHFNTPRHLSPSPSRLLQIAPNLELIQYRDLMVSKKTEKYAFDLSDVDNRDILPPSLPNSWDSTSIVRDNLRMPPSKHNSSQYNQDDDIDLKNKDELKSRNMSQNFIIIKLAKYLELTNRLSGTTEQRLSLGICLSLSRLYQTLTNKKWSQLIKGISSFTGKKEELDKVTRYHLELCYQFFKKYNDKEIGEATDRVYFIGGELQNLLIGLKVGASVILSNLNHAICLRKRQKNVFYVYDPNTLTGLAKQLTLEESVELITTYSLGKLVFCEREMNLTRDVLSPWESSSQFISDGGLIAICRSPSLHHYFAKHHFNDMYDDESCIKALTIGGNKYIRQALITMLQSKQMSWLLEQLIRTLFENKPTLVCKQLIDRLFGKFLSYEMREREVAIKAFTEADGIFRRHLNDEIVEYFLNSYRAPLVELPPTFSTNFKMAQHKHRIKLPSLDNAVQAISFLDTNTLNAYTLALQAHQKGNNYPVFVIQEDIDLDFHARQLTRDENNHALISENSHPLFIFLNQYKNNKHALIIINCEELSLTMMNRYEDLFSGQASNDIRIIALITSSNEKLRALQDQSALFEDITPCTIELSSLLDSFDRPTITPCDAIKKDDYVIDLFNSKLWRNILLGQWQIINDSLVYQEGSLARAIESGKPIVLANAPWNDRKFIAFIQQMHVNKQINNAGRMISVPDKTTWKTTSGYSHLHITKDISAKQGFDASAPILNPYTLRSFYWKYTVDEKTKALKSIPGIIEQCRTDGKKSLQATLSHPLSDDDLACLAAFCRKHGLKLNLHTLETSDISSLIDVGMASYTSENHNDVTLYVTNDYDAVTLKLCDEHSKGKNYCVFNVTGCSSDDLLDHIIAEPIIDKDNQTTFQFKSIKGAIIQALEAGQDVILKGEFSSQLAQALTPWLLDPQFRHAKQLTLVTDSATHFNYMSPRHLNLETAEKLKLLSNQLNLNAPENASVEWKTDNLSTMRAKLIYAASQDGRDPWQGLNHLDITIEKTPLNIQTYEAEAKQFDKLRYNVILSVLTYSPFVFISGITGVGKTMFINRVLQKHNVHVFNELGNLAAWAKSSQRGLKVLFLDEFNIGTNEGDVFEDLFSESPSVLDPKTHQRLTLTKEHKVIFAGNPISYSVNRHMPRLIERHGCSVIFDPITPAYLYKSILKPLFKKHPDLEKDSLAICEPLFNAYRYACSISGDEVLMTPRELSMMVMLTIAAYERDKSINPVETAANYALTIGLPLIPPEYQSNFTALFQAATPAMPNKEEAHKIIADMLALRQLRQFHTSDWSKKMKTAGLGGLVLSCQQGEPGIDFLKESLQNAGVSDEIVILPKTMKASTAKSELTKAFHDGKIVIIEAIGRRVMLENHLNSLLMGINPEPDSKGARHKPGFMTLSTHIAGEGLSQVQLSTALAHRLVNIQFPRTKLAPSPTAEPGPDSLEENEITSVSFEEFKAAYHKEFGGAWIKDPLAKFNPQIQAEGKLKSIAEVEEYAKANPNSRTARVLAKMKLSKKGEITNLNIK